MNPRCAQYKCRDQAWRANVCKTHWFEWAAKVRAGGARADLKGILLAEQGFKCANPGCRAPLTNWTDAHLDHDHDCCGRNKACVACTRGVICRLCNLMLGYAKDDPERLRGGAEYLEAFQVHGKPIAIAVRDGGARSYGYDRKTMREDLETLEGQRGSQWRYRPPLTASSS
ncbi:endonuclease VII [Mycobacterium phage Optimus]|uniref:Endonuclease VII n=1 Tax=Mycobacterium phage Optimus TaxID=2922218 RepID=G1DAM0_9CAUD|nr:endonuclease VII [Mycobacterium phage Optimus]AEJ92139.1 endonuclease VII [Mycobacterium phage Optimus]